MNQSELEASTYYWRQAREKTCEREQVATDLVWVLLLIGRESGARFFNQSQSEVKQNQSKTRITFDTQLKTALFNYKAIATVSSYLFWGHKMFWRLMLIELQDETHTINHPRTQ